MTNLRTRCNEDAPDFLNDVQLFEIVKSGVRDISFKCGLLPQYAEVTLDGSSEYLLPSDIYERNALYWYDSSGIPTFLKRSVPADMIDGSWYSTARPEFYQVNGDESISIFGSSTSNGSLRLYGTRRPTNASATSEYIDLPESCLEALYLYGLRWYYTRRRVPDESQFHQVEYNNYIDLLKNDVIKRYTDSASLYGVG
jgi:hypothetical protein